MNTSTSAHARCARVALTAVLLASLAGAEPARLASARAQDRDDLSTALARWRAEHGDPWRMAVEPETGYTRLLYGGAAAPAFAPTADEDFVALALNGLAASASLHGVELETLEFDEVTFLPLGLAGSSDKQSVRFRQAVSGVPVLQGSVNVLFDARGRLLSIDVTGLPRLAGLSVTPSLPSERAEALADDSFAFETGASATRRSEASLVIAQHREAGYREARLAWRVERFGNSRDGEPQGYAYLIDAHSGVVLRREQLVHEFDVSGVVSAWCSPGLLPDTAANPEVQTNQKRLRVNYLGNFFIDTDANGDFTLPFVGFPIGVTARFDGPYCTTDNLAGDEHTVQPVLTALTGNVVSLNDARTEAVTAEANAFFWVNELRAWIKSVNPSDNKPDFKAVARVNATDTCGAFFVWNAVEFRAAGGGCSNAAYSTIVLHEMGHWMNEKYSSGNGPDGMGEGLADAFAMYATDQPVLGQDFQGAGTIIRSGSNSAQYWGDGATCQHSDVHACGEVLMGALWNVRHRLTIAHPLGVGQGIANGLFSAWLNAYDDTQIHSIIETHWLLLDDDDGNLSNGTPHLVSIDCGFMAHGFPGADIGMSTVHVDSANTTAPWLGSPSDPFRRVKQQCAIQLQQAGALRYVESGGVVVLAAGVHSEGVQTINQNVRLTSTGGTATLR